MCVPVCIASKTVYVYMYMFLLAYIHMQHILVLFRFLKICHLIKKEPISYNHCKLGNLEFDMRNLS